MILIFVVLIVRVTVVRRGSLHCSTETTHIIQDNGHRQCHGHGQNSTGSFENKSGPETAFDS